MKKFMYLAMGAIMLGSMTMSGCSTEKETTSKKETNNEIKSEETDNLTPIGQYPIVKDKITLKMFSTQNPQISDFTTNEATLWLEEKTNIKIEFQLTPSDAVKEKLNIMMATGDYPDLFMRGGLGTLEETKYGVEEKILIPLDDLIEKNMVEFKKLVQDNPQIEGAIKAVDGKIYGVPGFNDCYHCSYSQKMWINTAWLEKLGLQMPTTTDEFYNVLKTFKEKVPGGIPLSGSVDGWNTNPDSFIMNAFIFDSGMGNSMRTFIKEGMIETSVNKEEYKEGLKYLNKLYGEGLLDQGAFTQKTDQLKQLIAGENEPVLCVPGGANVNWIDIAATPETYKHYVTVPALKGPNGVQQSTFFKYDAVIPMTFAITTANQYPEATIRWIDSFYNYEVSQNMNTGKKDIDWKYPEEGEVGLTGEPALMHRIRAYSNEPQNVNWQDFANVCAPSKWRFGEATDPNIDRFATEGLERLLYEETKNNYEAYPSKDSEVIPPLRFLAEETTQLQTITVELEKYIKESRAAFIMGNMDLDKDWDKYIQNLDNIGLKTYMEIQQKAYDRQFE